MIDLDIRILYLINTYKIVSTKNESNLVVIICLFGESPKVKPQVQVPTKVSKTSSFGDIINMV